MSEAQAATAGRKPSLFGLLALGIVLAGVVLLLVGTRNKNEAPFTPQQVHPKLVGLQVVKPDDALGSNVTAALRRLGGAHSNDIYVPNGHRNWQYVVGRVDVSPRRASSDTEYEVIVVDNRIHRVVAQTFSYPAPQQAAGTGQGWDGADSSLHRRFDWRPSGFDQAAYFTPGKTTSFPFYARLDASTLPVTNEHNDLSVILALTHGSDDVYWAEQLN
jgi:hypothetical protein